MKENLNESTSLPALVDAGDISKVTAWAEAVIRSDLVKFKKPEDVIIAVSYAQQVGVPIATALTHIDVIEGKIAIGTHLSRALLQRGRLRIETIEDYVPVFQYKGKEENYTQEEINEFPDLFVVFPSVSVMRLARQANEVPPGKTPVVKVGPIDHRTTIKITRRVYHNDGSYFENSAIGSFSLLDAQRAELTDRKNYQRYPKQMLWARAFSMAASRVAGDLLLGATFAWDYDNYEGDPLAEGMPVETDNEPIQVIETKSTTTK